MDCNWQTGDFLKLAALGLFRGNKQLEMRDQGTQELLRFLSVPPGLKIKPRKREMQLPKVLERTHV